ncbi:MAG: transposase [Lentisphaeria bacterium]
MVKIISPKKVKGFLQGQKTDANDALAIAIAALQVGMIFSPAKEIDQQYLQTLEKSRKSLDNVIVALGNNIRAFVYEYGIAINLGYKALNATFNIVLEDTDLRLPQSLKTMLRLL